MLTERFNKNRPYQMMIKIIEMGPGKPKIRLPGGPV